MKTKEILKLILKHIIKGIIAPFKFIAWILREILIYILVHAYKCSVMLPKKDKFTVKKGKKNGK